MKLRDGGKGPTRINPSNDGERMAVESLQREQAIRNNPMFQAMESMRQDMAQLAAQNREITMRFHALLDFHLNAGLLLTQDIDENGNPVEGTVRSPDESPQLFEALVENKLLLELPKLGFEAYFVEHSKVNQILINVQRGIMAGALDMPKVLEILREFNNEEGRIHPIRGDQFGLDGYLNANPDKLSDEEIIKLAEEFKLNWEQMQEDKKAMEELAEKEEKVVHIHRP